jgi:hypothetical protein
MMEVTPCIKAFKKSGLSLTRVSKYMYGYDAHGRTKFLTTPGHRCRVVTAVKFIEACGFDPVDFDV